MEEQEINWQDEYMKLATATAHHTVRVFLFLLRLRGVNLSVEQTKDMHELRKDTEALADQIEQTMKPLFDKADLL